MSEGGGGAVFGCGGGGRRSVSAQNHVGFCSVSGAVEGETEESEDLGDAPLTDAPLTEGIVGATRADFSSLLICFILRKEKLLEHGEVKCKL